MGDADSDVIRPSPLGPWALALADRDLHAADRLRILPGIHAAIGIDRAWLRGERLDDALDSELRLVPGAELFHLVAGERLIPRGRQVPTGLLPTASWLPLRDLLPLTCATRATAAAVMPTSLMLVPGADEAPTVGLLLPWAAWRTWVDHAPAHRLVPLRFACSTTRQALILGEPLPPLPGLALWSFGACLLPAGQTLAPRMRPEWLARRLGLAAGERALITTTAWQLLPADAFQPVTRAAVRQVAT